MKGFTDEDKKVEHFVIWHEICEIPRVRDEYRHLKDTASAAVKLSDYMISKRCIDNRIVKERYSYTLSDDMF